MKNLLFISIYIAVQIYLIAAITTGRITRIHPQTTLKPRPNGGIFETVKGFRCSAKSRQRKKRNDT